MASGEHGGGFSLDARVCVEGADRPGLERLLRDCARPAFARERLREIDAEHLVDERVKPGPGGSVSGMLALLERIERLAARIPPPHRHRHRYGRTGAQRTATRTGHRACRRARESDRAACDSD